jgi:hypothetical protein
MRGSQFNSDYPRRGSFSSAAFSGIDRTNNLSREHEDVADYFSASQDDVSAMVMDDQDNSPFDVTFENKIRL